MPSEPASETSPATGPATEPTTEPTAEPTAEAERSESAAGGRGRGRRAGSREYVFGEAPAPFEIVFDPQRNRHLAWASFHLAFGGLLVYSLGTIGKWIGLVLLLFGAVRAWKFARTLLAPPGRVTITRVDADLPASLCAGDRDHWKVKEILNVFYLRRSLSWIRTSPVLIIETVGGAYRYPRDWFESDSDQRRLAAQLAAALARQLPENVAAPIERRAAPQELSAGTRRNRAIGFFIAGGAVVMAGNLGLVDGFLASVNLPHRSIYVTCAVLIAIGAYYLAAPPPQPSTGKSSRKE